MQRRPARLNKVRHSGGPAARRSVFPTRIPSGRDLPCRHTCTCQRAMAPVPRSGFNDRQTHEHHRPTTTMTTTRTIQVAGRLLRIGVRRRDLHDFTSQACRSLATVARDHHTSRGGPSSRCGINLKSAYLSTTSLGQSAQVVRASQQRGIEAALLQATAEMPVAAAPDRTARLRISIVGRTVATHATTTRVDTATTRIAERIPSMRTTKLPSLKPML